MSWVAVLLGVIPVACSLTTHGDDYVEGGASGGAGTPGASGSSTASGASGPGSTATSGASTTGGGGGGAPTGVGGAGGASNASSSAESSSSSAGAGGAGGGPVDPCGNGIINEGEECDDMNSPTDTYCNGCQITCTVGKEHPTTHHCYGHSGGTFMPWANAKATCESVGGYLATLTNQDELDWIIDNLAPLTDSYLGGNDMTTEGTFAWITGEQWTWPASGDPWDGGEPNGSGDCLHLKSMGSHFGDFDDVDCALPQAFYCEREPAGMKP